MRNASFIQAEYVPVSSAAPWPNRINLRSSDTGVQASFCSGDTDVSRRERTDERLCVLAAGWLHGLQRESRGGCAETAAES
ncbi:hypothetical protein VZT92_018024 [Zoarces viviparus]|uniref:Uncharacterized protein n=1 Tax=Zoarces viviparus TaxID=48416 RepID=A0AAW1EPK4_ZOAVI